MLTIHFLEQSTAALSSLSESYSSLDSILSSSRTLVSSLLRSQKSDTWYLETAFYLVIGTIIWLVFRRIFYGPLWWMLLLPLKMAYRVAFTLLGAVGLASSASQTTAVGSVVTPGTTTSMQNTPSAVPDITARDHAASVGESSEPSAESILQDIENMTEQTQQQEQRRVPKDQETNVDDISPEERARQDAMPRNPKKRVWENTEDQETNVDDISPEERARQDAMPRNPKKRMWEENVEGDIKKDEL